MDGAGWFERCINALNEWVGRIVGFAIVAVVLVIIREIVARGVFNAPSVWTDETMTYLAGMGYVLAGGYTMLHRKHVIVDLVYDMLTPRKRFVADALTFVLFFAYMGTLIWFGWSFAWESFEQSETTGTLWSPIIWPVKFMIPLGGLLLLLQGIANLIEDYRVARGAAPRIPEQPTGASEL
jgi:TRAP-type mannitol/chloroaromatic compound transport system permease small subunit